MNPPRGLAAAGVLAAALALPALGAGPARSTPTAAPASTTAAMPATAAATPAAAATGSPPPAAAVLGDRIAAGLRYSTAGLVAARVDVGGLGTVTSRNADTAVPPASTQKTFTGATVLLRLDPAASIATPFRLYGRRSGHTLYGRVVVVGRGDPTLTSAQLRRVARHIRAAGITRVTGGVQVDASRYDGVHTADGWKPGFVPEESGPLSALVVDGNTYSATAVAYPALAGGRLVKRSLAGAGVRVDGVASVGPDGGGNLVDVYRAWSPPVGSVVRTMLRESVNMYAEQFLKELAARAAGTGTTAGGVAVVRAQGEALGVPLTTPIADGSGLSRHNRATPATEVAWLEAVRDTAVGTTFRRSLAVACVNGTLETRMCGTAAAGRVWAKTGTLDGVYCLAGYTWTRSGRRATFSFLLSGAASSTKARAAIDRAVVAIASFGG